MHVKDGIFKCKFCDDLFAKVAHRDRHMVENHNAYDPNKCDYCGKVFKLKRVMRKHRKIHERNSEEFMCELCAKTFKDKDYLKAHMRTHPGMALYKCLPCNREFSQKINYTKHMQNHKH